MVSFKLVSAVRLGIKSLRLHKLRSGLTMLGIIFGVCSVIAMLAIGYVIWRALHNNVGALPGSDPVAFGAPRP